jgi:hypothetical protein
VLSLLYTVKIKTYPTRVSSIDRIYCDKDKTPRLPIDFIDLIGTITWLAMISLFPSYRPSRPSCILSSLRLVPMGPVPPPYQRGAGGRRSSGRERAGWIPPGGSGRYRPALARVGRHAGAGGGRERGGAVASAAARARGVGRE